MLMWDLRSSRMWNSHMISFLSASPLECWCLTIKAPLLPDDAVFDPFRSGVRNDRDWWLSSHINALNDVLKKPMPVVAVARVCDSAVVHQS